MIYDHTSKPYHTRWKLSGENKYNGAYYYSKEIVKNIIPKIKTNRSWVTVNTYPLCEDKSIVFIHDNIDIKQYDWLKKYKDLILICGIKSTCEKVKHLGTPIYLPLSVDIKEVEKYKVKKKTKKIAYIGRKEKITNKLPKDIDYISNLSREEFLSEIAKYKSVYAVGRCAIEAKILGCEILPYDDRFKDPSIWEILDNKDVIKILQSGLDKIDNKKKDKSEIKNELNNKIEDKNV